MYSPYDFPLDIKPMLDRLGPIGGVYMESKTPIRDKLFKTNLRPVGNGLLVLHKYSKITNESVMPHHMFLFFPNKNNATVVYNAINNSFDSPTIDVSALYMCNAKFCVRLNMIWHVYTVDIHSRKCVLINDRFDSLDKLKMYLLNKV